MRSFLGSICLTVLMTFVSPAASAQTVSITVSQDHVHEVDPNYLSVAIDTSVLLGGTWWNANNRLDLAHPRLRALTRALAPAYLRIGGTDADRVFYILNGSEGVRKTPFEAAPISLSATDWEQIISFAKDVKMPLMFTLNAGPGARYADGSWNSDNARELVRFAAQRHDPVAVWELGNEINAYPLLHQGFRVSGKQYGYDLISARKLLDEEMPDALLAGPAVAFWPYLSEPLAILPEALAVGGEALDIVTWHYYPQQSERCLLRTQPASKQSLLSGEALNQAADMARLVSWQQQQKALFAPVWLGETGHAQCGGQSGLSGRFVSTLWWADQLGLLALQGHKVQIRQSLVGSDYGLLREDNFEPTPDYWLSLLWKKLMGRRVLKTTEIKTGTIRSYAHCDPENKGWTLLLLNLSPEVQKVYLPYPVDQAEVYALSSDALDSPDVRLNGKSRMMHQQIPALVGVKLSSNTLSLEAQSVIFVHFNQMQWPGCTK